MKPMLSAPAQRSEPKPWQIISVAGLVVGIATMDLTLVGTAVPILALQGNDGSFAQLVWTLVVTAIPLALLILPALARANRVGRKRVALLGMILFTVGALIATIAPTESLVIVGRLLQSGIALGIAGTLAICLTKSGPRQSWMYARWSAAAVIGLAAGPLVAGALLQFGTWQLIFLVEAALGLLAYLLIRSFLVESRANVPPAPSDLTGGALFGIGLLALASGFVPIDDSSSGLGIVNKPVIHWVFIAVGCVLMILGAVRILRVRGSRDGRALLPTQHGASIAVGAALAVALLTDALYLAGTRELNPWWTGVGLTPLLLGVAACTILVRRFANPLWGRSVLLLGGLLWVISLVALVVTVETIDLGWGFWILILICQGSGMGAIVAVTGDPRNILLSKATGQESVLVGIAGVQAARQLGTALGIILIAIIVWGGSLQDLELLQRSWVIGVLAGLIAVALGIIRLRKVGRQPDSVLQIVDPSGLVNLDEPERGTVKRRPTAALLDFLRQRDLDPLETLPMFSELSEEQRNRLSEQSDDLNVAAGECIYEKGESADALYVVRGGRVDLMVNGHCVRRLGRGDVFGEAEVLDASPRSVTAMARRDASLMRIQRSTIMAVEDVSFFRAIAISLSERLAEMTSRISSSAPESSTAESIISVISIDEAKPTLAVGKALEQLMQQHRTVIAPGRVDRLGLERAESLGDLVLLIDDPTDSEWSQFCRRVADRTIVVTTRSTPSSAIPRGSHVVIVDQEPTQAEWTRWYLEVEPASRTLVRRDHLPEDLAPLRDRMLRRSLGLVLGGGGARGLAHIGVMDVLTREGIYVDRIAGTSMGALLGALFAGGLDPDSVDALCYELLVRNDPMSDYIIPRKSLLRGRRLDHTIQSAFGEVRIEALPRSFACVSVDLVTRQEVVHRFGPLGEAVAASSRLPGILPPVRHNLGGVHVDGGLLNNLPVNILNRAEGPIIAVQVGGQESLTEDMAMEGLSLPETIMRSLMMASDNANEESIGLADMLIRPNTSSAGLTEFHRLDAMREAGQQAAEGALPAIRELLKKG